MKSKPHFALTGILTGVPFGTAKPSAKYVYQKTKAGLGNIPEDKTKRQQVRLWVRGTLTNTPAQQPQRARFALGVAAWHSLTPEEKETWRAPGTARHLNRFQAFMRDWCLTQPLPASTVWDGGLSIWDDGATTWPLPEGAQWDGGAANWDGGATIFDV